MGIRKRPSRRKKKPPIGDNSNPYSLAALLERYLEYLKMRNYAGGTIFNHDRYLRVFVSWAAERALICAVDISKPILERYQRWLYQFRKEDGTPLSFHTQSLHLRALRSYFKWLSKYNHIASNPASEIEMPKLERRLPKAVLTAAEAEQVLNQADVRTPMGIRDRAIMETLYSTGMRRMELVKLRMQDLDIERGTIIIREGKWKKDRTVPIGDRAVAWVTKYLLEVRQHLVIGADEYRLFVTAWGDDITPDALTSLVHKYIEQANIGKSGSCHIFRHTCATLMLEGGADIRYIQQLLGHEQLETTQIYTQVSIRTLKAIHSVTHPARLERRTVDAQAKADHRLVADPHIELSEARRQLLAAIIDEDE
jgi:integrase/recombinase XerD